VVALIVIPPENLPDVMRAVGKVLRELRLASNMVVRELGGALDEPPANRLERPANPLAPATRSTVDNIAQSATPADPAATPAGPAAAPAEPAAAPTGPQAQK